MSSYSVHLTTRTLFAFTALSLTSQLWLPLKHLWSQVRYPFVQVCEWSIHSLTEERTLTLPVHHHTPSPPHTHAHTSCQMKWKSWRNLSLVSMSYSMWTNTANLHFPYISTHSHTLAFIPGEVWGEKAGSTSPWCPWVVAWTMQH